MKANRTIRIAYGGEEGGDLIIKGYSDSDWAGDHATRKSTSGFIFILNGGSVSWCSKRQATVNRSGIRGTDLCCKEATWLRLLLIEIGLLDEEGQYAEIKVTHGSIGPEQIKADAAGQEGGVHSMTLTSNAAPAPLPSLTSNNSSASLSLKGDNQGSIAFAHNPVFHASKKNDQLELKSTKKPST